jgi:hypothetical protein
VANISRFAHEQGEYQKCVIFDPGCDASRACPVLVACGCSPRVLAARDGTERLIEMGPAVDPGFVVGVLATMLDSLARFCDQEIPVPADTDVGAMRELFRAWREQLRE